MQHRGDSLYLCMTRYTKGGLLGLVLSVLLFAFCWPAPAAAQGGRGRVVGRVVHGETREPLAGVQVSLEGTRHGVLTGEDGRFLIEDVRPGVYRLIASGAGSATAHRENVRVAGGEVTTVEIELHGVAFSLDGVVATGVVTPLSGERVPFTVGRVTAGGVPILGQNTVAGAIQGKVAGVRVIRAHSPGADASILLRTPTSVYGSNAPLYVVDGVALSPRVDRTVVDIESLDVKRVEVIKGAAAVALYGSRANNGVVSISTGRGTGVAPGRPRLTVRSEYGVSGLARRVPTARSHYFQTNDEGYLVDGAGNVLANPFEGRVIATDRFMDNPWGPNKLYDNFDAFFGNGQFRGNTFTIAQNTELLNYSAAFNNYSSAGILRGNDGFERNSGRLNLDFRPLRFLSVHLGGYHVHAHRDLVTGEPFEDLLRFHPDVDLGAPGLNGEPYRIQPAAPFASQRNPLYWQVVNDDWEKRERTLGTAAVRLTPSTKLSLTADIGYDRSQRRIEEYRAKGTPLTESVDGDDPDVEGGIRGRYRVFNARNRYYTASFTAAYLDSFGPLTARAFYRGAMERERWSRKDEVGLDLERRDLSTAADRRSTEEWPVQSRASSNIVGTVLDLSDRYIADVMVRWEGVRLPGMDDPDHARYYRVAANWRISEEPWFRVPGVSEFQLRFARGTAGSYPTDLQATNPLRPEKTTENEFTVRAIFDDRISVDLSYAASRTEDLHIPVSIQVPFDFNTTWRNGGTISGRTYEATIEARLVDRRDFGWWTGVVLDHSRHRVDRFDRPCYREGMVRYCEGMVMGEFWTTRFHRKPEELTYRHAPAVLDQFQVNDDGLLVWVGEGNSYRDGVAKGLWGTSAVIDGYTYQWGLPFQQTDESGNAVRVKTGDGNPDLNFGWSNTVRWKRFTFYAHVNGQLGGDIYNTTKARMYTRYRHGDVDQVGKPEGLKKPIDYYNALYNSGDFVDYFIEDGSYAKLSELSVRYDVDPSRLRALGRLGVSNLSVGLVGRNLYTLTGYSGFDPEVGTVFDRRDVFPYPAYRTITGEVRVGF